MRNWTRRIPPYEGEEPYLYFAFAEADSARVWKLLRPLLARGCRVWYCFGAAGGAEELLRRQERAAGAALTLLYLSDAACADKDTKSYVLVNQKFGRPILCLDPDGTDRRLLMGLHEDVPHLPLYELKNAEDLEMALIHAEGFSQQVIGEPVELGEDGLLKRLSLLFVVLALLLAAVGFAGFRYLRWFRPEIVDELTIGDPVVLSALRDAAGGGAVTQALADSLTALKLESLPESWDDLESFPALERILLPQQALLEEGELPEGDYVIELYGGGA